jgi:glycosyltransferase involved in cell wall biosynthesis
MRISVITGSYPPQVCGVGDYTMNLCAALESEGEQVTVFQRSDWAISRLSEYARELRATDANVFLLQYPTEGYGYSLVPHLLMLLLAGRRRYVALHEYKRKSLKGKLATYLFFLFGCRFIFTNELDARFARSMAPWIGRPTVIPIGSNIPWNGAAEPRYDVATFGLIRPQKGIEQFLVQAAAVKTRRSGISVTLVGDIPRGYEAYATEIIASARRGGIEVRTGMSPSEVADFLSHTKICFFPFADGLSERRGSVLAALGNGCLVVGTGLEEGISDEFRRSVLVADEQCQLETIIARNEEMAFEHVKSNARQYCGLRSWRHVATEHRRTFGGGHVASGR